MDLLESLKAHLDATLPSNYKTRIVSTYSKKVEVYEPEFGNYPFSEFGVYHNVTVDITAFVDDREGQVHYCYGWFRTRKENLLPLTSIVYEGHTFPAPCNSEQLLVDMYGYIGEGAVYDPETKKVREESYLMILYYMVCIIIAIHDHTSPVLPAVSINRYSVCCEAATRGPHHTCACSTLQRRKAMYSLKCPGEEHHFYV